jgi:hypothetical protein
MLRPILRSLPLRRVARGDLGTPLASAGAAIVRVRPAGQVSPVCVLARRRLPTHSLATLPDGTVLFADTTDGCLTRLDPDRGEFVARVKVTDEFLRGICPLPPRWALVGSQRDVLLVDLDRQKVLDFVRLTENPNVSVFDIKELPPGFAPLPGCLGGGRSEQSRDTPSPLNENAELTACTRRSG